MVGAEGAGWTTVTKELAIERGGPDRFMSDFRLLNEVVDRVGPPPDGRQATEIGRLLAHAAALRRMSAAIAGLVQRGENPVTEAALLKDVGTAFERDLPERVRHLVPADPSLDDDEDGFNEALCDVLLRAPSFTIRGGTRTRAQGAFQFKIGCDTPLDHPLSRRLAEAGRKVADRSGGQFSLRVFPNSQLGGDSDMLRQVRSGGLELFAAPSLTLSTLVPLSNLPSVGYASADYDRACPSPPACQSRGPWRCRPA